MARTSPTGPRRWRDRARTAALATTALLWFPASAHAQSASDVICAALKKLETYNFGSALEAVIGEPPRCTLTPQLDETYYLGSAPLATSPSDVLPLLAIPFVSSGAYVCALGDSDGISASDSAGILGVSSRLNVVQKGGGSVKVERVGTISLFGARAVLERQDFALAIPKEDAPGQFGMYLKTTTHSGPSWDWEPNPLVIHIPAGPGVIKATVRVDLHGRSPQLRRTNQLLTATPPAAFRYDDWKRCIDAPPVCQNVNGIRICQPKPCEPAFQEFASIGKFEMDRSGTCPGICNNLADRILPYRGAFGGASGRNANYIHFEPFTNWFHLGHPGGPMGKIPGEPVADIDIENPASSATTWGTLKVNLKYGVPLIDIALNTTTRLAVRNGLSLRQVALPLSPDFVGMARHGVTLGTALDAEAAADLDVVVDVKVNTVPAFDPPPVSFNNLVHRDLPSTQIVPVTGAVAEYDALPSTTFRKYTVKNVPKADPDGARLQCMLAPASTPRTQTPISNAGDFVRDAARGAIDAVHPCNVNYCMGNSQRRCDWNPTTKTLDCTAPKSGCTLCADTMELCNASGNVIPQSQVLLTQRRCPVP